MAVEHKKLPKKDEKEKMKKLVLRWTIIKSGIAMAVLLCMTNIGFASYLCEGVEHPRTIDMDDVTVIKQDGKVMIVLEGNYDVIMPERSKHWETRSMGWSMAPGYMYIVNYDDPGMNDITAFSNGKFGVSHQVSEMNETITTKSIYGSTEEGWTEDDYLYKYVGAFFIK